MGETRRSRPRPRPRYELTSDLEPEEIMARVKRFLAENERIKGMVLPGRVEMAFTQAEQHLWSPQLIAELSREEGETRLRVRFGPHPHVWGMYMAMLFVAGITSLLAIAYGASQATLGQTPTAWLWIPAALVLFGLVYGASFVGQGLGFDQMYELREKLEELAETRAV